ncbi:MAG: AI-2E family transporter [Myxococcota bacterium]|nr:AI-2E family transporter [Myxococcota bacterium]
MPAPNALRWRRRLFLGVAAVIAAAVVVAAHDVMLPFVLAVLIAYVLTPLVAAVERHRVPRGPSIIIVYTVVLGSIAVFLHGIAPRIAHEFRNLRGELPTLAAEAREKWVPAITERLRAIGVTPAQPAPPDDAAEPGPASAFIIRSQPDGTIVVDVGAGVTISEAKHGYVVEPTRDKKDEPFDPNRLIADAVGKTFAYAQHNSLEIARAVRNLIASVSRAVFIFFITLMMAAYIILTRERIVGFVRSLVRESARTNFDALFRRVDEGLSGVVRGQLIICGINGVLSAIGFAIVGLKYWPVMALMAAVFSLVPIFGSIASAVPAVVVGLTQGLGTATFVLLWIIGIHQFEANVLNPKIMGDSAKIHPVLVIFSLLVGEHFFDVVGALLAVPAMSIAQSLFLHFRAVTETTDPELDL